MGRDRSPYVRKKAVDDPSAWDRRNSRPAERRPEWPCCARQQTRVAAANIRIVTRNGLARGHFPPACQRENWRDLAAPTVTRPDVISAVSVSTGAESSGRRLRRCRRTSRLARAPSTKGRAGTAGEGLAPAREQGAGSEEAPEERHAEGRTRAARDHAGH